MRYEVLVTDKALEDISGIGEYITYELLNPVVVFSVVIFTTLAFFVHS